MGLAPVLVESVFDLIRATNALGITIFVVEQNATMALSIAHRGYVLQSGHIVLHDTASNLLANDQMRRGYLGGWTDGGAPGSRRRRRRVTPMLISHTCG